MRVVCGLVAQSVFLGPTGGGLTRLGSVLAAIVEELGVTVPSVVFLRPRIGGLPGFGTDLAVFFLAAFFGLAFFGLADFIHQHLKF